MLVQDEKELKKFHKEQRIWQGMPTIEMTKCGRLFASFYSGGTKEDFGNYCVLVKSDDKGENWSDAIAVIYVGEEARAYDPCLWIDPLGRLWWIWNYMPDNTALAYVCDKPDSEKLCFGEPITIGYDNDIQKPTVLSTGEWLFPVAVWDSSVRSVNNSNRTDKKAFVYKTSDHGKSFQKLGGAIAKDRSFDEHTVLEKKDGSLAMYIRTRYGIAVSLSYDGGKNWVEPFDSKLGGPNSRFFIRRLKSGRILLINHKNFNGRNNLTAMISEDDGKTWSDGLLLDERDEISYPDAVEGEDGFIYITYDRERGFFERNIESAMSKAREILMAKITETEILVGKVFLKGSCLKKIVSKLGQFRGDSKLFFLGYEDTEEEYIKKLSTVYSGEEILYKVFSDYGKCCINLDEEASRCLDEQCAIIAKNKGEVDICDRIFAIKQFISILKNEKVCVDEFVFSNVIVERIQSYVGEQISNPELGLGLVAQKLNISKYYMCHVFKQKTGITVSSYINFCRITKAKRLLVNTNDSLTRVGMAIGILDASYFSKWFKKQEGVTPLAYRRLNDKK